MKTSIQTSDLTTQKLSIPMYSWWQMFLISAFDSDVNPTKWVPSLDPEVPDLEVCIPRYSIWQMLKMTLLQTDE